MKFSVLIIIIIPSRSPDILISPTNKTDRLIILLEPEVSFNAPPLPSVEKSVVIIFLLLVLDDNNPAVNSSLIYHHLMKYLYFYHRSTISTFPNAWQCIYRNSYKNCRSCAQAKNSIITICMMLQPCNINNQL